MLRPTAGLLGSSRAARRANLRAERVKSIVHVFRALKGLVVVLFAVAFEIALLCALPFVYLAAAYLALDLPAHWLTHRDAWGGWGVLIFFAALTVCLVGIARAAQETPPVAPVRPQFAKAMLTLSWVAALLLTIGDLVSS